MKYRKLGQSGIYVSELCLGAMTFGGSSATDMGRRIGALEQPEVNRIVERAITAGINFFDTADVYSQGDSERKLGQALKDLGVARKDVVVATKVYGRMGTGPNDEGASRTRIMDGIHGSLERLQLDHVDLYQIHLNDSVTPLDETLDALDTLVRRDLVRYVGVSNWPAWRIAKAQERASARHQARFVSIQAYYSIAGRDLEREVVPMARAEGLGLLIWSPLAGGLLSGKYRLDEDGGAHGDGRRTQGQFPPVDQARAKACIDVMRGIADAHGASVAQVALAWLLSKQHVTSAIVGTRKLEQLEDNLGAVDLDLAGKELSQLDDISKLPAEYPGWMLDSRGRTREPKS